ncbi:MAG: site-2 protease family protein [Clostridia bacterium]|nr:site-2 protease family protein [Clostridia bacterium]
MGEKVFRFFSLAISLNVVLAVFNLLPIPPLDGSKILAYFLPYSMRIKYIQFSRYTFILILIIFFLDLDSYIILPIVQKILDVLNIILNL